MPCRGRLLLLPEREKTKSGNIVNSGGKNNNNSKTVPKMTSDILRETCETETNRRTEASGSQMPAFHRAHGGGWFSPLENLGRTMSWKFPGDTGVSVLVTLATIWESVAPMARRLEDGKQSSAGRPWVGKEDAVNESQVPQPLGGPGSVDERLETQKTVSGLMQGLAAPLEANA